MSRTNSFFIYILMLEFAFNYIVLIVLLDGHPLDVMSTRKALIRNNLIMNKITR